MCIYGFFLTQSEKIFNFHKFSKNDEEGLFIGEKNVVVFLDAFCKKNRKAQLMPVWAGCLVLTETRQTIATPSGFPFFSQEKTERKEV